MSRKTLALSFVLVLSHSMLAQEALQRRPGPDPLKPNTPCPHPYSQTLTGGTGASTPVLSDFPPHLHPALAGSVWNQPATDRHFAHTFRFPATDGCCVVTQGTLTVTIKALNTGGVGSSAANNDAVHVYSGGGNLSVQSQQPWLNTGVTAGTVTTVKFNVPANVLATGMVSFLVQDDSAVQSAQLVLEGCCLKKQK